MTLYEVDCPVQLVFRRGRKLRAQSFALHPDITNHQIVVPFPPALGLSAGVSRVTNFGYARSF